MLLGAEVGVVKSAVFASKLSRTVNAEIESVLTRAQRVAQIARTGQTTVATLLIGANDLGTAENGGFYPDAQSYYVEILQYVATERQGGATKVAICTLLPNTRPGYNALRVSVNSRLRTGLVAGDFDFLIDFDTTTMGAAGAEANTALYGDGVHPTAAGNDVLAAKYAADLRAPLGLPPSSSGGVPAAPGTTSIAITPAAPAPAGGVPAAPGTTSITITP